MKVSVVITVKNKAEIIEPLIKSLQRQSKKPDEIIVKAGGNRSQGRNAGIKAARNEIIAVTDAGCVADKHWLERLVKPLTDKKVVSVAGFYRPVINTKLQAAIAPFLAVMPDKFNPKTYLPSSRSLAFRKGIAWYPEELNYCEDLIFARRLEAAGKMIRVKEALVDWQIPANLREFFTRVKNYASGDVRACYWPHLIKIISVWLRYGLFILVPPLFLVYLLWPFIKHRNLLALPLQLVADLAVMAGSVSAIISPE